jgi:putative two-component system response regulator
MEILINALLEKGVYADEIREWDLDLVISSARLHDVGKIEIPDCILNKPSTLTHEEFDAMKTHSAVGEQIIDKAIARTGDEEFLYNAKIIATYHHERWNGLGYPYGMKDFEIPLQARIMAIIDVYDALVSERPYKEAFSHEKAMEIIMGESGEHFDPHIAEVFYSINEMIRKTKDKF